MWLEVIDVICNDKLILIVMRVQAVGTIYKDEDNDSHMILSATAAAMKNNIFVSRQNITKTKRYQL